MSDQSTAQRNLYVSMLLDRHQKARPRSFWKQGPFRFTHAKPFGALSHMWPFNRARLSISFADNSYMMRHSFTSQFTQQLNPCDALSNQVHWRTLDAVPLCLDHRYAFASEPMKLYGPPTPSTSACVHLRLLIFAISLHRGLDTFHKRLNCFPASQRNPSPLQKPAVFDWNTKCLADTG